MNATTPAAGEQSEDDSEDIETKIADLPADEASNRLRRRLLLARFWRSARGFWGPRTAIGSLGCSPERSCSLSCSILQHPMA